MPLHISYGINNYGSTVKKHALKFSRSVYSFSIIRKPPKWRLLAYIYDIALTWQVTAIIFDIFHTRVQPHTILSWHHITTMQLIFPIITAINNWIQIVLSRKLEKHHCNLNHWNQIETFITQGTKTPKMNLTVNQELTRCLAVTLNFWSKNALGSICPGGLPIPTNKSIKIMITVIYFYFKWVL